MLKNEMRSAEEEDVLGRTGRAEHPRLHSFASSLPDVLHDHLTGASRRLL